MAKIGNSDYPDIGLNECLRIADIIRSDFAGEVRRSGLAHILDMSPNGGAFGARLGAMRSWGIVQGRSTLRLTTDAATALTPETDAEASANPSQALDNDARAEAMRRLASNVPLFADLHARLPDGPTERPVLVVTMQELTDASVDEIEARIAHFERIFLEARRYLQDRPNAPPAHAAEPTHGASDTEPSGTAATDAASSQAAETSRIELRFAGGEIVLTETPDNIELLISALSNRRRKLLDEQDRRTPRSSVTNSGRR